MDRRRNRDFREIAGRLPVAVVAREQSVVDQHREHLLDEERVSLRGAHDPVADGLVELRAAEEVGDELHGFTVAQPFEEHRGGVELPAAPARPLVEELGTREADEQDRRFASPVGQMLDEVEERGLGPLQVVEEDDERAGPAFRLEETADRPGRFVRRSGILSEVDRGGDPLRDQRCLVAGQNASDPGERFLSVATAEGLGERPVRDALAVGKAAAAHHRRLASDTRQELRDQPRLADARGPENREQEARAFPDGSLVGLLERGELAFASDHRGIEAAGPAGQISRQRDQPVRPDRFALALQTQRLGRLDLDRVANEAIRGLAEQDLAGRSGLLEALGHVHRVTGRKPLALAAVAGDHLAGVHAGANGDRDAPVAFQLLVQGCEPFAHLRGRAHRSQRVVLVQHGDSEDGHDGVPDELLDRPFVALDDRLHLVEVPAHHASQRLGVELLAERGRPGDVGEDHGHDLADVSGGLGGGQGRRARAAECEPLRVLLTAAGARNHAAESRFSG